MGPEAEGQGEQFTCRKLRVITGRIVNKSNLVVQVVGQHGKDKVDDESHKLRDISHDIFP